RERRRQASRLRPAEPAHARPSRARVRLRGARGGGRQARRPGPGLPSYARAPADRSVRLGRTANGLAARGKRGLPAVGERRGWRFGVCSGRRAVTHPLPAALAIDGGNSKTDLALIAQDGSLLALVRGPGMPHRLGPENVAVIDALITSALRVADQDPASAEPAGMAGGARTGLVAAHLVACVANVDLPAEERELERMLSEQG